VLALYRCERKRMRSLRTGGRNRWRSVARDLPLHATTPIH